MEHMLAEGVIYTLTPSHTMKAVVPLGKYSKRKYLQVQEVEDSYLSPLAVFPATEGMKTRSYQVHTHAHSRNTIKKKQETLKFPRGFPVPSDHASAAGDI